MALTIRNLKIRNQLLLVSLPPLFVLLCAVGLAFYAYWSVITGARTESRSQQSVVLNESFLRHATEAYSYVQRYVITRQVNLLPLYEKAATDGMADLTALIDLEAADPGQQQELGRIRSDFDALRNLWAQPAIEIAGAGGDYNATATNAEGGQRWAAIRTEVLKLQNEEKGRNLREMQGAEKVIRQMLVVGVSLAVLLAIILLLLTRVVTGMIVSPVMQLIRASEQVGRGDLAVTLPPMVNNEFGVLSRSFSHMTSALRREREEIASLNRFSEAVTQCTSELEVYDLVLHALKERFQPLQIVIFKLNQTEKFLEAAATLVALPKEVGAWPVIEEPQNCKAIRTGRSVVLNDVQVQTPMPLQVRSAQRGKLLLRSADRERHHHRLRPHGSSEGSLDIRTPAPGRELSQWRRRGPFQPPSA